MSTLPFLKEYEIEYEENIYLNFTNKQYECSKNKATEVQGNTSGLHGQ